MAEAVSEPCVLINTTIAPTFRKLQYQNPHAGQRKRTRAVQEVLTDAGFLLSSPLLWMPQQLCPVPFVIVLSNAPCTLLGTLSFVPCICPVGCPTSCALYPFGCPVNCAVYPFGCSIKCALYPVGCPINCALHVFLCSINCA